MRKLKVLDLFSGIGGFSLGLETHRFFETVAFCEQDKYCQEVPQKHWKGVKIYNDIKKLEGKEIQDRHGRIDICTGGVPCQPFSVAGKQNGTNDDRYLWPDMFRIIEQLEPTFVIIENVKGINIQEGMVFETVCSDLKVKASKSKRLLFQAQASALPTEEKESGLWATPNTMDHLPPRSKEGTFEVNAWTQEGEDKTSKSERAGRSSNNENYGELQTLIATEAPASEKRMKMKLEKKMPICHKRSSGSSESDVANTESKSSNSKYNGKESRETSEQEQIESRRSD